MLYYSIVKSFFLKGNKEKLQSHPSTSITINIGIWKKKRMFIEMNYF